MFNKVLRTIGWGGLKFKILDKVNPSAISAGERQHRLAGQRLDLQKDPERNTGALAKIEVELARLKSLDPTLITSSSRDAMRNEAKQDDLEVQLDDSSYTRFRKEQIRSGHGERGE